MTEQVLVAQIGARRHYAVPRALHEAGRLAALHTDLCGVGTVGRIARLVPGLRRLADRRPEGVPDSLVRLHPVTAVTSRLRRPKGGEAAKYAFWAAQNAAFARSVCRSDWGDAGAVYVFNGAGLEVAEEAKRRGLRVYVDQTMAPWRWVERRLAEERTKWSISAESTDPAPLADREKAEWGLADAIVCGSRFVADAVAETAGRDDLPCVVVPFGHATPAGEWPAKALGDRSKRVLFVGTLGLRKGGPYLAEAARLLGGAAEVRAVGPVEGEPPAGVACVGPVPRSALDGHYRWADVLVLPSLAEGSANVCYEALGRGVPVICTHESGSVVQDGVQGRIVPSRDAGAIAEAVRGIDGPALAAWSGSAKLRAAGFTPGDYSVRLVSALQPDRGGADAGTVGNA